MHDQRAHGGAALSGSAHGRESYHTLSKLVCSVNGEFDYMASIRADSPSALDRLPDEIGETEGVSKTTTSVVLAERITRS